MAHGSLDSIVICAEGDDLMDASLSLPERSRTRLSLRTLQRDEPLALDMVRLLLAPGHSRLFRACAETILRDSLTRSDLTKPPGPG
jgi:hypothetical protein